MRNFNLLDDKTIQFPAGVFAGVTSYDCYPGGELEGIMLSEKNMLVTHAGELVPAYTETHRRKHKYSVKFHKSGAVKAVALDALQEIVTPIGEFPAELVTFYDTGELHRFFPLDGKISGMHSEEDEKALAIPLSFDLTFTAFTAIISGVAFYKSGAIRSITLFPGEKVEVATSCGKIPVRNGFSLYESSGLESAEPAVPVQIDTPIGRITAFDPDAIGINADSNSLVFDENGAVKSFITAHNRIAVQTFDERLLMFSPREVVNPLDGESTVTQGLKISIGGDTVTFTDAQKEGAESFPLKDSGFTVAAYTPNEFMCSPTDCASCSMNCNVN